MKKILLNIIRTLHVIFVMFVIFVPFLNIDYLLCVHLIIVPFLILHWICNTNTCALTIIEKKLRQEIYGDTKNDECITCKLIEPVYDFKKNYNKFSIIIYTGTILLWCITVWVLYSKYNNKNGLFKNLFRIMFYNSTNFINISSSSVNDDIISKS